MATVLVTNDDGIDSPGLHELARAVAAAGHEVVVAAPEENMSGTGASIGAFAVDMTVGLRPTVIDGVDGPVHAVDGPPGLIVIMARLGAFGRSFDAVASGINPGWNTGRSVLHSGTVGAALTGANGGWSGVAVSTADGPTHWRTAAELGAAALEWVLDAEPPGTVVNLNVPDLPSAEVRGVRWATLANPPSVQAQIAESGEGFVKLELQLNDDAVDEASDTGLVRSGWAAVTLLTKVSEAPSRPVAEHLHAHLESGGRR